MVLGVIYSIISIACTGSIYYFLGLYHEWYWFWVILIGLPIFYVLAFGINIAVLFIISKMFKKEEPDNPNYSALWWMRQISFQLFLLSGTIIKKINFDKIDKKQKYMIIYNHTSNFDPMMIYTYMPKVICVTKPSNKKIPIAGPFMNKAGYISIDRDNDAEGIKSIQKAIDYINKDYGSICISPEGTRSVTHELLPFHPGSFNIAKRANVPVLVIGLKNVYNIHKNFLKRFTKCEMKVLGTIQPDEVASLSTVELSNKTHEMFETYLGGF